MAKLRPFTLFVDYLFQMKGAVRHFFANFALRYIIIIGIKTIPYVCYTYIGIFREAHCARL